jgi:hypothetical protein
MASIRRVVLDVLKPHDPPLQRLAQRVADRSAVEAATATLVEIDREVQNVLLTVEGEDLDVDALEDVVEDLGGTVHSVDQVACGSRVVEPGRGAHEARSPSRPSVD